MNDQPEGVRRGDAMPDLRDYLQRIVGVRGRTVVTSVTRYPSWHDLPWERDVPKPEPLPPGRVLLIGMRDTILGTPGPEGFIALPADQDRTVTAAMLAEQVIKVRRPSAEWRN